MTFSIITPSFRNSQWLRLCIASVADQQGVKVEHIVQDSCSDDGTGDWLPQDKRVKAFIEKDQGMYDAVNRGFRRASGDLLAYLNCDEQYLPGALQAVVEAFEKRPEADIVLADTVIVNSEGQFVCCRKSMVPWAMLGWTFIPAITSSLFIRRSVLENYNLSFDIRWRDFGDAVWFRDALSLRLKFAVLRRFTSVFADTGENMNLKPNAQREKRLLAARMPGWARWFRLPLLQLHRLRALGNGLYHQKPFAYSLYTKASPLQRVEVSVPKPSGIWWGRHEHARPARPL